MVAQYSNGNSKLETALKHAATQNIEDEEYECDCWNHSILEELQWKMKTNFTLRFYLTLPENHLRPKKRNRRFRRFL